jgi:hypothetical protein
MTTPQSILGGLALVAVAIVVHALASMRQYQLAPVMPGMVARIDMRSGAMEWCGDIDSPQIINFVSREAAYMKEAQVPTEVAAMILQSKVRSAKRTHCWQVNLGPELVKDDRR